MAQAINFDKDARVSSSHFVGYLNVPYSFEEAVARLYTLAGYDIFADSDGDKTSFEVIGTYGSLVFYLYDYKEDDMIHIGSTDNLDVAELTDGLRQLMAQTTPTEYRTRCHYSDFHKYGWP